MATITMKQLFCNHNDLYFFTFLKAGRVKMCTSLVSKQTALIVQLVCSILPPVQIKLVMIPLHGVPGV